MDNENEVIEKKEYSNSDDPALLLVKGVSGSKEDNKQRVKDLATAISTVFQKHNVVRLRCIGKGAIGNAVYAHAIARGELSKQGVDLQSSPVFKTVILDKENNVERTSILMELNDIPSGGATNGGE
jgi:stage V sporulation protein SpoVS